MTPLHLIHTVVCTALFMLQLLCSELTPHTLCHEALTPQTVRACFVALPLNTSAHETFRILPV